MSTPTYHQSPVTIEIPLWEVLEFHSNEILRFIYEQIMTVTGKVNQHLAPGWPSFCQ